MLRELLSGFKITGLRARLLAVVLIAVVPLFLLLIGYATIENRAAQAGTRAEAARGVAADAAAIQDLVSQSRATLVTFGITYAIQRHQWDLAQGNTERLLKAHPEYAVLGAADGSGTIQASVPRTSAPLNIADTAFFKEAVASRDLVVSGYTRDPITGKAAVIVALPAYTIAGKLVAVDYIAFDPATLAQRLSPATGDSVETLVDASGTVVAQNPAGKKVVGRPLSSTALSRLVLGGGQGSASLTGPDGAFRQYFYTPVGQTSGEPLSVVVGYSPEALSAGETRTFLLALGGFVLATTAALLIAAIVGTYSIYRPAHQLAEAAERVTEGDLAARVDFGERSDEIGALGREFNDMAASIQHQVADLEAARNEVDALNEDLERRVRRRTAELEEANKELEAFSYSVSHDLRSPLRAIDGFSNVLLEDYSDVLDEQGRNDLKRVRENANRMGDLIDSLLRLSRLSRQEMAVGEVDLSGIAQEIGERSRESAPERDVTFVIEPDVTAQADPDLLRIVLDNLLSNAWKFTSKHASARIEFGATRSPSETVYFVRDDGAGFDMAYAGKLFGAFQRVHGQSEFPGIGIGLATTARIIRRHGGRIWAEGEPEKGATFFFTVS